MDKSKKANSRYDIEGEFSGIALSKSEEGLSPGMQQPPLKRVGALRINQNLMDLI